MSVKIYSQNVRGMRDFVKRRKIFNFFKDRKVNILCVQETFSIERDEKFWKAEWGGEIIFSHGDNNSRGVAICFSRDFEGQILDVYKDVQGRYIICTLEIQGQSFVLTNTYGPNQDDPEFFVELFKQLSAAESSEWIVGGDFNLTLQPKLDRKTPSKNIKLKNAAKTLIEIMEENSLCDVWRNLNTDTRRYTWHGRVNLASRIDFFLISESLLAQVKNSEIVSSTISDHSALYLEIDLCKNKRGRGFWKFNEKLLEDKKYIETVATAIDAVLIKNSQEKLSPALAWEMIKNEVVGQTICYSIRKAKENNVELMQLQQKIEQLETFMDQMQVDDNDSENIFQQLVEAKQNFDNKYLEKVVKTINNTKAKFYNEGEASTKYFFNLQKRRYANKCMNKVFLDNGSMVTERKKVLQEQKRFFEQVYQSDPLVSFTLKNQNSERQLNDHEAKDIEAPLTIHELHCSVKGMAKGKTPGSDGLTPAFYLKFWDRIATPLHSAINYAIDRNTLHISARTGILNLIPKKNKELMYVKNWRPITLLNTDYKILSRALALRIKKYLPKLISEDQTGFMSGRNIATNIRKIIDIDEYCEKNQIDAMILSVDFEKCFDFVETKCLDGIMKYFNFGPNIRKWVTLLFQGIRICTLNNGFTSDYFSPTRGLFQGNPIASYLYLLTGQVLNDQITKNTKIKGIRLGEREIRCIQFADDLNMPLLFDQASLDAVLLELKNFQSQVGLKINVAKSSIYRVGSISNTTCLLNSQGIEWKNDSLNVLGVQVTKPSQIVTTNMEPLMDKMASVVNCWRMRDLGLIGKVLIINSLLMSLLVYRFTVLPTIDKSVIKRINQIWSQFLWDNKKPKIAWNILTAPRKNGGLGLSDLSKRDISLKAQWVAIYTKDTIIKFLADNALANKLGEVLWLANFGPKDCEAITKDRGFWFDVITAWSKFNFVTPYGANQVLQQVIWHNSFIKIKGRMLCNMEMFHRGIVRLVDLTLDGKFLTSKQFAEKFPGINILEYLSIIHALPEEWRKWLHISFQYKEDILEKYSLVSSLPSIVSEVYRSLHTNVYLLEKKWQKWEAILQIEIWPNEFLKYVNALWKVTNFGKLRSFQYKLLNHAIITNADLKKWKIIDSDKCTFCKSEKETVIHLLYHCSIIQNIWKAILELCRQIDPSIEFSDKNIIFNVVCKNPKSVINVIVLITKQYLYKSRCLGQKPNVIELKEHILWNYKMEKLGAMVSGKLRHCEEKWQHAATLIKY